MFGAACLLLATATLATVTLATTAHAGDTKGAMPEASAEVKKRRRKSGRLDRLR